MGAVERVVTKYELEGENAIARAAERAVRELERTEKDFLANERASKEAVAAWRRAEAASRAPKDRRGPDLADLGRRAVSPSSAIAGALAPLFQDGPGALEGFFRGGRS